jgi:hypothetical protein
MDRLPAVLKRFATLEARFHMCRIPALHDAKVKPSQLVHNVGSSIKLFDHSQISRYVAGFHVSVVLGVLGNYARFHIVITLTDRK